MKKLFLILALLGFASWLMPTASLRGQVSISGNVTLKGNMAVTGSAPPIAFVSSTSGVAAGAGQTGVAASAFNVATGNALVIFVRCLNQLSACSGQTTISDTAGNTFLPRQYKTTSDSSTAIAAFTGFAVAGNSSDVVTATFTGGATTTNAGIIVRQYSGVGSVQFYDTGATGQADSTTDPTSDTFTTYWPNDVLVMGTSYWDSPKTASASGSWGNVAQDANNYMATVDNIVSSIQTLQQGTLHLSASSANTASIVVGLRRALQNPTYLNWEGFENNNLDKSAVLNGQSSGTSCTINSNASFVHSGSYSLDCYYEILSGSGQDINQWRGMYFDTPQNHIFLHGYFYLKTPEAGATAPGSFITQRKLAWFDNSDVSGASTYAVIINSWNGHLGSATIDNWLALGSNGGGCAGVTPTVFDIADITWDHWHELKVEVQLNTSGNSDGKLNMWLDGTQVYTGTSLNLRGTCSDMTLWSTGRQSQQNASEIIKEHRYWDDLAVANSNLW